MSQTELSERLHLIIIYKQPPLLINPLKYDYLIVGSGLFGATFAHLARKAGKRCLVIDRRPHLGGNVHCLEMEGIHVHQYGAHIFHTSDKRVWDFVNGVTPFNRYTNCPVANYEGRLYNLPFNMNTFYQMWGVTTPAEAEAKLREQRAEAVARMAAGGVGEPRNLEEQALALVGRDIYERLVKGYTEKQWGRPCTELPAFIIKRLPVRMVFDNNYFDDAYQGIPVGGYNRLIDGLLKDVETQTGIDFFTPLGPADSRDRAHAHASGAGGSAHGLGHGGAGPTALAALLQQAGHPVGPQQTLWETWPALAHRLVYTGPIDQFFSYRYGRLAYRTVRFETETLDTPNYQGCAVVNYTEARVPYTRIIEHKHFEMFGPQVDACPRTVISREYATEWQPGLEPYYPVNDDANNTLYKKYKALADEYPATLTLPAPGRSCLFGGRLAEYKYYDMAPVVARAMELFEEKGN